MSERFLCFGEVLLRLSPFAAEGQPAPEQLFPPKETSSSVSSQPAASFDAWWGGSEANVAIGLARLGRTATLLTTLPSSPLGEAANTALNDGGIDVLVPPPTEHLTEEGQCRQSGQFSQLGLYFASTRGQGKTVIYQRAHSAFAHRPPRPQDVDWRQFDAFHTSGINPALSQPCVQATSELLATARSHGLKTSFDLNLRRQLWSDRTAGETLLPMLSHVDLLIGNSSQLANAFALGPLNLNDHCAAQDSVRKFIEGSGVGAVVLTGRDHRDVSAKATPRTTETRLRALWVHPDGARNRITPWFDATDRIGSGDAFTAGFLTHCSLEAALAAASLANQSAGDFPTFTSGDVARRQTEFFGA